MTDREDVQMLALQCWLLWFKADIIVTANTILFISPNEVVEVKT
jgi:hypothetical protein